MKILAIARVKSETTLATIQPHLVEEVKRAWTLYRDGIVREMYSCRDRPLGVVFVLECGTVDEARTHLDALPFVREQLIDFEIIPLGPFAYFERLFAS